MSCNKLSMVVATAMVLGMTVTAHSATVQSSGSPQAKEQIIVEVPGYVVKRSPTPGRKYNLMNAEVASMSRPVSYADLDLSRPEGADKLKQRVNDAATQICRDLNIRFPATVFRVVYGKEDCEKRAVDEAMTVVNEVVGASAN